MISILLADDHPLVRRGLRAVLEAEQDFEVVGETGDGPETLRLVESLRPHILVLDLMMPGLPGLEIVRQVSHRLPGTRIVILSMHANEAYVLEALRSGATGYVLKGAVGGEMVQAIRAATAGRRYLSPPLSDRAIATYVEKAKSGVRGPRRRADPARARSAGPGRPGAEQRGHRRQPWNQPPDGRDASRQPDAEARLAQSDRPRPLRHAAGPPAGRVTQRFRPRRASPPPVSFRKNTVSPVENYVGPRMVELRPEFQTLVRPGSLSVGAAASRAAAGRGGLWRREERAGAGDAALARHDDDANGRGVTVRAVEWKEASWNVLR